MKFLIVFTSLLAVVLASPSKYLEVRNRVVSVRQPEGRIFKGQGTTIEDFPYQVGLLLETKKIVKECGGSIIGNHWVLTAAHCTKFAITATVYMGGTTYDDAEVIRIVSNNSIFIHPRYNHKSLENDISLIRIPFTGFNVKIQRVDLPALSNASSTFVDDEIIVTGWGRFIENSSNSSTNLLWGSMKVIPNAVCAKFFPHEILPSNICTLSTTGVNTCDGDSGGPVVFRPEDVRIQVGIASSGARKCKLSVPAINTRVTEYLEWIKETTGIYY